MKPRPRVLVIEDSRINLELITTIIGRLGYAADGAQTGEDGLDMMDTTSYGLVLLDLQMPGMGGEAAAHLIRARHGQDVRLVLLSAQMDLAEHPAARLCDAVLPKPIHWPDLGTLLRQLLPLEAPDGTSGAPK